MNPSSEIFGWAILSATFLGPVFAVFATRYIDGRRERDNRRLYIFRTLMATRRNQVSTEHVTALNLIEIDFQGKPEILKAWREYFENLRADPKDERRIERAIQERPALLTKLLHAIARTMHYKIEQLDIMAGGYTPQGFVDDVQRQREMQTLLMELLQGKRALQVKSEKD
jgi:hypothetical protein